MANSMAWNFGNLLKEKTKGTQMTIEWPQPPGVTTAEESLAWTELGLRFVQAARGWENIGNEIEDKYRGDVQGLKAFVKDRGEFPGSEMDRVNAVFGDKSGRIEVLGPWARVDPADVFSNTHMQELS